MVLAARQRLEQFMAGLIRRNPGEHEFHQAVHEVAEHIIPYIIDKPIYNDAQIMERLSEPDRIVIFRVCWEDDKGNVRANRGYRVQHNNAIGPYKGGIRFHSDVNLSTLKFLAFEQTFKNSLTGLPMGGAKGGSDFNPKEKSDREVMRFCQSFMTELSRHIGSYIDIPAGDIGVGAREISYLFGQFKRISNTFTGTITGKGLAFGRNEATGYGAVYFMEDMFKHANKTVDGNVAVVSGSGNVAQFTVEKLQQMGVKVVTLSDSSGYVYDADGINTEKLEFIKHLKNVERGRISTYAEVFGAQYFENERPWNVPCQMAFPCATQNEINKAEAEMLVKNGCLSVVEGSNMPSEWDAIDVFQDAKIMFVPSKAANAGGVAVSGLELTQNSMRLSWTREETDQKLRKIMSDIHERCVEYGQESDDYVNYLKGANIAGFIKVANAMIAYGIM